ncbi:MAG: accessory Sec system translocase SecA2 [Clostridia bacterium]|nr:accessory Sec system translocase SecA2 [Clostridia bacterium]
MKNGYKTLESIKKDCIAFAEQVLAVDYSNMDDDSLCVTADQARVPEEIATAVTEVIFRKTGLKLFSCQLQTAFALYNGHIAELSTGEGKTLAGVLAAIMYVKSGRKVQVLVFNDYLAKRDATENQKIYEFCGVSVGYVTEATPISERAEQYEKDVLYISAREAGYDSIRNFVAYNKNELIGGNYDVAIVDEADSILIDEASIPLILAGKAEDTSADEKKVMEAVKKLTENDYDVDEQDGQIWLNDNGIEKIEAELEIENLYDNNSEVLSDINTALQALYQLTADKDYIVKDNQIAVVDESTGRIAVNRKFPNALHRFVEMKEGITNTVNTKIYCSMTVGAFMNQYSTICGMTGTAATSANEFETTYSVRTIVIDPHTPCIRTDLDDSIFLTNSERDKALLEEILSANAKGQPVLIGTASVKDSEELSKKLTEKEIEHTVLNARNDEKEAAIIAEAGKPYSVTVSTNMAGRGVDIKLGGANEEEKEFTMSVGGLYVISSTVNRSRRIDNQLKGRAGRQGDPGMSKFFISLEDENIAPFFDEDANNGKSISEKEKLSMVRTAQTTLEGNEAEARYTLKKYSYIIEHQRELISAYRLAVVKDEKVPNILKNEDPEAYEKLLEQTTEEEIINAEKVLTLYYINQHFSNYLEAMEDVKSGIHLSIVAGKNPFDEFNRSAIEFFEEMKEDLKYDLVSKMQQAEVVDGKIDISLFNIKPTTGTWTYMVDDSAGQFNHLPALMNMVSKKIKEKLSFSERLDRFLNRKKN